MPSRKAALKDLHQSKKKTQRNIIFKKLLKKAEKKISALISKKDVEKIKTEINNFFSQVDKAVSRKILHKNTAARKKSRVMKKIKKISS
ncbi:MAG: 30S ribosomal protein S20 [Candidatus Omnitrophica bacterium]|nr:30S ribosomal protein S20 [Candidatus Omnitrophota bacterium]MBU1925698.1 30S ribosomal protein S20 [Candidatus Omnitrophota bacterium]